MNSSPEPTFDRLQDALLAATLFAANPIWLGGMVIKAHAGPVRSRFIDFLKSQIDPGTPWRKLPLNIQDERLLGGLDLAATLNSGKPVLSKGLLAEINGGVLLIPMSERMSGALAARIASVMDRQEVHVQREGLSAEIEARFGVILLDESVAEDERVAPELIDRIAFHLDLTNVPLAEMEAAIDMFSDLLSIADQQIATGRPKNLHLMISNPEEVGDEITQALCGTAMALGIDSLRAVIFARRVAEIAGHVYGHVHTQKEDAALAARLVLSPRATVIPMDPESQENEPEPPPPPENEPQDSHDNSDSTSQPEQEPENLEDVVLESAKAAIPAGLLAMLLSDQRLLSRSSGSGKSGAQKKGGHRGRPLGSRPGLPTGRARLSIIDTLRAAAPWQKVRGGLLGATRNDGNQNRVKRVIARSGTGPSNRRLQVRAEDFRIKRFKEKSETTTIFVVDASGSSAIHRLAEAKGAVELLLADCYVRRDQVAVIAFRGKTAELILPPTRSLVRAKRGLSGLPGGGGTPLALAIMASNDLAAGIARKGETPLVVMLTDGKANINREGNPGREQAQADAMLAAQQFALSGVASMVIDTSPQPSEAAQKIAQQMHARYLPLPHAGATQVSQAIKQMSA